MSTLFKSSTQELAVSHITWEGSSSSIHSSTQLCRGKRSFPSPWLPWGRSSSGGPQYVLCQLHWCFLGSSALVAITPTVFDQNVKTYFYLWFGIISTIIILAGAIALIIGFGISGRHSITVTTLTSAGNIGEDGILSCTFEPDIKLSDIVIRWLKEGVMGLVHEFKEGKDDLSDQDEMFRGRTAVFTDQVIVGNASLRLKNVQLADAGTYKCYIITSKGKGSAYLDYKTGAFSIPEVNVDYNASSESLRCEAPRWFPQPTVVWASQVDQGANFLEVSNTTFELNSENVTMKVVSVLYNVTINNTYSCMIENDIAKATGDIKVTDSEIKRRSHLQLLNSKASLCVSSLCAISWVLLPLSPYLMLK
ncbi:V-set domain-containing T-cell activation inhibitor 1 isoform X2 [Elephas maximus indicus]|uniref:V-set domain-containing T-cell activation inhibitor 1 isoform X2 n=1 Tax=Elephas maximus indicus TaxID=99487 RepID=UPI0021163BF3|nr:V-set domain-containing T-cell activation inhibitor 1 isoform X2 [Elephas maximus indicus]XP_049735936.1 V-set domain-containing T-cell activation inhibitor 1 isoform X2 [Elephas maximus indicus]